MQPLQGPRGTGRAGRAVARRASPLGRVGEGASAGCAVPGGSPLGARPAGMSAAQLAKFEALEEAEAAELAQLLQRYTVPTRAARFAATTRAERAGNVRSSEPLDRLSNYPQLKQTVSELQRAGRERTLLEKLRQLVAYEQTGALRGEAPPDADYWGRPGAAAGDAPAEVFVIEGAALRAAAAERPIVLDDDDDGSGVGPRAVARGPPVKAEAGAAALPAQAAMPYAAASDDRSGEQEQNSDGNGVPDDDDWLMDDATWHAMEVAVAAHAAGAWHAETWQPLIRRLKGRWIWADGKWELDMSVFPFGG